MISDMADFTIDPLSWKVVTTAASNAPVERICPVLHVGEPSVGI